MAHDSDASICKPSNLKEVTLSVVPVGVERDGRLERAKGPIIISLVLVVFISINTIENTKINVKISPNNFKICSRTYSNSVHRCTLYPLYNIRARRRSLTDIILQNTETVIHGSHTRRLVVMSELAVLRSNGKLFQTSGAATEKRCLPNTVLQNCTERKRCVDDRREREGSYRSKVRPAAR